MTTYSLTTRATKGSALTHTEMDANLTYFNNSKVVSVKDYGAVGDGVTDDSAAIQAALNIAASIGGTGICVYLPNGAYALGTTTLSIPSYVQLLGGGKRESIITYSGTGTAIDLDSVTHCVLSGFRIGISTSATIKALALRSTTADLRWCTFRDLEIAAGSLVTGQIGISAVASSPQIVTENCFDNISIYSVDKPIIRTDIEGNTWSAIQVSGFANAATTAINGTSHADFMQARINGAPAAGSVGYANAGSRNIDDIIVDIGATSTALNITGTGNVIRCTRPENLTPIGTFAVTNTVLDSEHATFKRVNCGGTALVAGDFSLSGSFGSTSTVDTISGTDSRGEFRVVSAGAGHAPDPTVTITFKDLAFPSAPFAMVTRNGGNQLTTPLYWSTSTTGITITMVGTPVAGEAYKFSYHVIG